MRFPVQVKRLIDGQWRARSAGTIAGVVERSGDTKEEALDRLSAELRYRIEWCPCSGVAPELIHLEVTEEPPSPYRDTVF